MEVATAKPRAGKSRRLSGVGGSGRRLSAGWRAEDAENFLEENDDESERVAAANQKRQEAEKLAKQTRSPYKETPNRKARTAVLTDMYSDAIQMCAENKINEKNSWALDLIDHMGRMIEQPSGGDAAMTNFQFASSTLDAGVKIYAYRVDSVYNETYKLIGGLNRAKGGEASEDAPTCDDAGDGDGEESGVPAKEAKRPRRVKPPSTNLEANPTSLDLKKLEMAFAVDPLFHRTSAKFDEGGAKGLLLINLPVRPGNVLSFDSSEARGAAVAKAAPPARIPLAMLSGLIPRGLDEMQVCADLAGMVGSIRTGVTTGSEGTLDSALRSAVAVHAADADASEDEADDPGGFDCDDDDDDGPDPVHHDDAGVWAAATAPEELEAFDAEDAAGDDPEADAQVAVREEALRRQLSAVEAGAEEGAAAGFLSLDEYVEEAQHDDSPARQRRQEEAARERVQRLLQTGQRWAGPGHWKFKAPSQPSGDTGPAAAGAAVGLAGRRGGKGKAQFAIDFGRCKEVLASLRAMDKDAKGTTLTAAALAKEQLSISTLPRDLNFTPKVLSSLFLKPSATVGRRRRVLRQTALRIADAVADGAAEDARDTYSDGGDDAAVCDDFGDEPAAGDVGEETAVGGVAVDGMGSSQLELLEEPAQVEQIKIGYAKVAKQVNIKGLKSGVWELLHDAQAQARPDGASTVSFRKALGGLASKVPAAQLPDVSFAYCFISLLHLANERGLEVHGSEALDDLTVTLPRG